jgi:uncharacterized protein YaiI (UPF0178 family)
MQVWIDADATPRPVRDVLLKAAAKRRVSMTFVANRALYGISGPTIRMIQVAAGSDVADDYIAENCQDQDLVITADIPLAARVVEVGAMVLQPHGRILDKDNVEEHLSVRDFHESLRADGVETGGPKPFGTQEKERFSNGLDRWLTQNGY